METTNFELFGEENIRFLITLIKNELLKYYDKTGVDTAINNALNTVTTITFKKVDTLPAKDSVDPSAIYMVPSQSQTEKNKYDEYFWDAGNEKFEYFGSSTPDLSGYVQKTDLQDVQNSTIQTIWDSVFLTSPVETA